MEFLKKIAAKLFELTQGRTTAFFIAFFVSGTVLEFLGRLSMSYVYFMGTLGGLVLGHSIKEDVMQNWPRPGGARAGGDRGGPENDAKS